MAASRRPTFLRSWIGTSARARSWSACASRSTCSIGRRRPSSARSARGFLGPRLRRERDLEAVLAEHERGGVIHVLGPALRAERDVAAPEVEALGGERAVERV